MAFQAAVAERKPTIACVGYVDSIGDLKRGRDGSPYFTIPISIKNSGNYGGKPGMDVKVNFSFLPEFFANDFDPSKISEQTHGAKWRGAKWSYDKNVISPKGSCTAMLQCMAGDQETFERFGAVADNLADLEPETIYDAVTGFLNEIKGTGFGYILRQPDKKTDQVNPATGKPVYELSAYYEVDAFFRLTPENVKKLAKRAEGNKAKREDDPSAEKFLLRFDPAELGFDVE